ncbi:SIMPL domain-containing protein [Ornithinibacillus sp. 179-J 7C1 HS]|uniref:SIMPL domain-containing protein n=1 Tax=Ornithinibacillus sp. 179-J 7C1 HS TaxID=3142384 RepID=UPI0039A15855
MYYYPNLFNRGQVPVRESDKVIKVFGEGVVLARPDQAIVTLGVITEDNNLQQAQQKNAQDSTNVINAIVNSGVSRENIQTTDYRVDIQYDFQNGQQVFRGYRITSILTIKIENIQSVGEIVDIAVDSGANTVRNIDLTISNPDRYYHQAFEKAIQNAKAKADTAASTLGVIVPDVPARLKELSNLTPEPPRPYVLGVSTESAVTTPIEAGQNQIRASVEATFNY